MSAVLDVERATLTLRDEDEKACWEIALDAALLDRACFREAYVWRDAGVICLGAAELVLFFALETGQRRGELRLDTLHPSAFSLFGHFGEFKLAGEAALLVLTYTDAIALDAALGVRWIARDLAVDGLTFNGASDDKIMLSAEMDPPGGWFDVMLDARAGRELAREPAVHLEHEAPL